MVTQQQSSGLQASDNGELAGYLLFRDEIEVANVPADQSEVNVTGFTTLVDYAFELKPMIRWKLYDNWTKTISSLR